MKTIYKKEKHLSNFTIIDNSIFNSGLSYEAIGLLSHILSLPEDWIINKRYFYELKDIHHKTLDRIFKELESFGYLKEFNVKKTAENQSGKQYIVYEEPIKDPLKFISESIKEESKIEIKPKTKPKRKPKKIDPQHKDAMLLQQMDSLKNWQDLKNLWDPKESSTILESYYKTWKKKSVEEQLRILEISRNAGPRIKELKSWMISYLKNVETLESNIQEDLNKLNKNKFIKSNNPRDLIIEKNGINY